MSDALALDGASVPPNAFKRLYRGETSFDFVGRRRWWFAISGIIILAGLISLGTRGLNFGIDFRGGQQWQVTAPHATVNEVQNAVTKAGLSGATVEILGGKTVQVTANLNGESTAKQNATKAAVEAALGRIGNIPASQVSVTDVGATWGSQITNKAIIAVIVFFVVVVAYISIRFEWKMAIAALLAVIHDLLVVVGVFALSGFLVTSDTVIAVLTIMGYSLYDTVVVFDRVAENTKGLGASGRMTYEDVVNLSMNQTLARSINTSLVAILPVLSVLVIGAQILGATTLQYFGLALVVGLLSGAYSSIFIASPLLAIMKERETRYANIRLKLANRADRTGLLTPRAAAVLAASTAQGSSRQGARAGGSRAQPRARQGAAQARKGAVIRPGSAAGAKTASSSAVGTDTDVEDELVDDMSDGAGASAGAGAGVGVGAGGGQQSAKARASSGASKRPGTASSQQRRPAPRPRKGKGSRKGRRR